MLKCLRKDLKISVNSRRIIFGDKRIANKVPLIFLDGKVLSENKQFRL